MSSSPVFRSLAIASVPVLLAGYVGARHVIGLLLGRSEAASAVRAEGGAPDPFAAIDRPAPALPVVSTSADGPVQLSAALDRAALQQNGDGLLHVRLTLTGEAQEGAPARMPTDLVIVMDRSGSMAGEKLESARSAVNTLIDALAPEDRFSLVTYDSAAELTIPLAGVNEGNVARWHSKTNAITDGGGTNMSAGLDVGQKVLRDAPANRAHRVVLISDGLPNEGDSSTTGLLGRARSSSVAQIPLTAVGVGVDFNEDLMRSLADQGTGNYYYLQQGANMSAVFTDELEAASATIASGLEIHLNTPAGVSLISAAGYPVEHTSSDAYFRAGDLRAGQSRELWLTLRVDPSQAGAVALGDLSVRYTRDALPQSVGLGSALAVQVTADQSAVLASINHDVWEQAVVTEEYNDLRTQVASAVKSGNKVEAEKAIGDYRTRNAWINDSVGSAMVNLNMDSLGELQEQVDSSFSGEQQAQKQNMFSKSVSADAYKMRRKGQMKP